MSRVSKLILFFESAQDLIKERVISLPAKTTPGTRKTKARSHSIAGVFRHSVKSDNVGVSDKSVSGVPPDTKTSGTTCKMTLGIQSSSGPMID